MKKYLTGEFVFATLLFIGLTVMGIAFVCYSYSWADEYSVALKYFLRIGGFISSIGYPLVYTNVAKEYLAEDE